MKIFYCSLFSFLFLFLKNYCQADCPPGSYLFPLADKLCYKYIDVKAQFTEAESNCAQYPNGHLASIDNSFINDLLAEYAKQLNFDDFWIGGNDLQSPDTYKWSWTDKTPFTYTNWAISQPNFSPTFNCIGIVSYASTWYTYNCFNEKPFVCEIPFNASVFTTPLPPPSTTTQMITRTSKVTNGGGGTVSTTMPGSDINTIGTSKGSGTSGEVTATLPLGTTAAVVVTGITSKTDNPSDHFSTLNPSQATTNENHNSPENTNNPLPTTSTATTTATITKTTVKPDGGSTKPPIYSCSNGWIYFEPTHSCYKNTTNKYNFDGAENYCTSQGANLASIENAAEFAFLNTTLEYFWYWIGLCSTDSNKTWKWIDGTPLTFLKWCTGAPVAQSISCTLTTPSMNCFTNSPKMATTYGLCKKSALVLKK